MRRLTLLFIVLLFTTPVSGSSSLDFDGVDAHLSRTSITANNEDHTFCAWVYPESEGEGAAGRFYFNSDGTNFYAALYAAAGNDNIVCTWRTGGTQQNAVGGNNSLPANQWQYVCCRYDTTANTVSNVVDGTEIASTTADPGSNSITSLNFVVGASNTSGGFTWDGQIAHYQWWRGKYLTLDEIVQSMHCPGSVVDSLELYWPIYGVDSPELDLSGNGYTGTVTNATASGNGPPVSSCGGLK